MSGFGESASGTKKKKFTHTAQAHQPVERVKPAILNPVAQLAPPSQGAIGNEYWNSTSYPVNYGPARSAYLNFVPPTAFAFSTAPRMPQLHLTPLNPWLPVGPMHYSHASTTPYWVQSIAPVGEQLQPTYTYHRDNRTVTLHNVNELPQHEKGHQVHPVRPVPLMPNVGIPPANQFAAASVSQSLGATGARFLQQPAIRSADASDDAPDEKEKNENPEAHARERRSEGEPQLSEECLKRVRRKLREAVTAIRTGTRIRHSLPVLYETVVDMCCLKEAQEFYDDLTKYLKCHVEADTEQFLAESMDTYTFLKKMNECWQSHCRQMVMIRSIFLYLDRTYVPQKRNILSIWDMGLNLFKKHVVLKDLVQTRTVEGLEMLIEKERQGDTEDRSLLESLLWMLSDLDICQDPECKLLGNTIKKNNDVVQRLLQEQNMLEYLAHVDEGMREQNKRLLDYLVDQREWSPEEEKEKRFVSAIVMSILPKGLSGLLDENRISDLSLLYYLYFRIENGLMELLINFNCYISMRGNAMVAGPVKNRFGSTVEQELLEFKYKMENIAETCFPKDVIFSRTLHEALKVFTHQIANKPAELIGDLGDLLDKIMVLFRFVHGKDVFEAFYKIDLSKRLLVGESDSVDAEKSLLSKLRQKFTDKLEGMFKDAELSKVMNTSFERYAGNLQYKLIMSNLDLNVSILTRGHSPTSPVMTLTLPDEMVLYHDILKNFYQGKRSRRKLQWQPTLGHCVLKVPFDQGNNELRVYLFQVPVLFLVNDFDNISLEEVKAATNIEDGELRWTLQSLACGKARVRHVNPKCRDVEDNDRFVLDAEFTNKLFRIKIGQIQMKETNKKQKATEEQVSQKRRYQIDVVLVRIMKMRKTLFHNNLIIELLNQLKFPVNLVDLDNRIKFLIERGYIERDRDNMYQYNYVA